MAHVYDLPGHLIRRLHQISVSAFAGEANAAGLDLTPVQFAALSMLNDHPDIDQATLAGLIAYDRVTLGGVVNRLAARGLIERKISATDVAGLMTTEVVTASSSTELTTVAGWMAEQHLSMIPVVDEGKLAGVVTRRSMVRHTLRRLAGG